MLQSMALHQMELEQKFDGLQDAPVVGDGLAVIAQSFDTAQKVHEVEAFMRILQKETTARDIDLQEACVQIKALQQNVNNITKQSANEGDAWILTAAHQDLCRSPMPGKNGLGNNADSNIQWNEGSSDFLSPVAYSKKSYTGPLYNSSNAGGAGGVPFARYVVPRQLDRMQGSRSLPHLPPVK